jgi:glycosyl transferase family 25
MIQKMPKSIDIYVINLDRHPDRLLHMKNMLGENGFTRIAAVDGLELADAEPKLPDAPGSFEHLTRFERGCIISHQKSWVAFLKTDADYACILEDDVAVSEEFTDVIYNDNYITNTYHIIKIETARQKVLTVPGGTVRQGRRLVPLYSLHFGSAGYIISRQGAEKLIRYGQRPDVPIDLFLFRRPSTVPGLNITQMEPALCVQQRFTQYGVQDVRFQSAIAPVVKKRKHTPLRRRIIRETTQPFRQVVAMVKNTISRWRGGPVYRLIPFN